MKKEREYIQYPERLMTEEERAEPMPPGKFEGHTWGEWYDSMLRARGPGKTHLDD